jgi:hypothetical protein
VGGRTVIIGDIHGRADVLARALNCLGLADEGGRWCGGQATLVQLGDLIDRGPSSLAVLRMMMRLSEQAPAGGGSVTVLMGNHELLALGAAFAGAPPLRAWWFDNGGDATYLEWRRSQAGAGSKDVEAFFAEFGPQGTYGRWLSRCPATALVGGYLCSHAGVTAGELPVLADRLAQALADGETLAGCLIRDPLFGSEGPFWRRRLDPAQLPAGIVRQVIGHTPGRGVLVSAGGKVVNMDVGTYYTGRWAALVLEDGDARVWLSDGRRVPVPSGAEASIDF